MPTYLSLFGSLGRAAIGVLDDKWAETDRWDGDARSSMPVVLPVIGVVLIGDLHDVVNRAAVDGGWLIDLAQLH